MQMLKHHVIVQHQPVIGMMTPRWSVDRAHSSMYPAGYIGDVQGAARSSLHRCRGLRRSGR
jgi:hypothetical protein